MNTYFILVVLLIGVSFIQLVWSLTDPRSTKAYWDYFKRPLFWKTYVVQLVLLVPQILSGIYFPWSIGRVDFAIQIFGIIICYVGIFFAIWAKLVMQKNWGVPGEHDLKRQTKLVTSGPFRFSRNPIYTGLLLLSFGFSLALRSYFIWLVIPLYFYFNYAIVKEEKLLEKFFGDQYSRYTLHVRRFL